MKTALFAALSTVAASCAAPALAADVEIKDAVARVVVIVEDRSDIGVEITPGRGDLPVPQVQRRGGDVRIDGGLRNAFRNCSSGPASARQPGEGATVEIRRIGRVRLEDAPLIVLRTPRSVDVGASGAVFGSVGRGAGEIDLGNGGCGDWVVANTTGKMSLALGGSGTIRAGTSSALEAAVGGSGSIMAGATRRLEASVGGSGSITVARVDGPGEAAIGGSGDITIRAGDMPRLEVAVGGSGNVRYGGRTADLEVAIAGSGDVSVAEASGPVSRSVVGSGTVSIGR